MGNNQSGEEIAKKVGSFALAVSYFTPIGVVTGPATLAIGTVGVAARVVGEIKDDDEWRQAGNFYAGMSFDAAVDGISGGAIDGVKKCGQVVKLVKTGCEAYGSASDNCNKAHGKPFIPTPDPQKTVYIAKHFL